MLDYFSRHTNIFRFFLSIARWLDRRIQLWALKKGDTFTHRDWEEIQAEKLRRILIYAHSNTNFWKEQEVSSSGNLINILVTLRLLPITSRILLKKLGTENFMSAPNEHRSTLAYTSGSTSEPLEFHQDERGLIRRNLNTFEEFRYIKMSLKKQTDMLIIGLTTHSDLDDVGIRFTGRDLDDAAIRKGSIYTYIHQYRPSLLISTPSLIKRLALFFQKESIPTYFKAIMYRGEHLDEQEKKELNHIFNCRIYGNYGTRECSIIGMECEWNNFHTAPWMNFIEIINERGQPVPIGQKGRIVVTHFENEVMPFIRYEIGDIGKIDASSCPCDRQTPTITFVGRSGGSIETSSGKSVMILSIATLIAKNFHSSIERFQMEHISRTILIFRFIPLKKYSKAAEGRLLVKLSKIFDNQIQIKIERVSHFRPNATGKIPLLIKRF